MTDQPVSPGPILDALRDVLAGRRIVVLAGAGCSTESGIPDYRGPDAGPRVRAPIQYREFVSSEAGRQRYWARSTVGWTRVARAEPNAGHRALADLERSGRVRGIITQNVDGLHQSAGSRTVVELHGSLAWVRCLGCGEAVSRERFQERLLSCNHAWAAWVRGGRGTQGTTAAPDGDADLDPDIVRRFEVPGCASCGGVIKPDVVFFGENVPKPIVERAWKLFGEAEVLLVVGSSLTVYSGRRFIYRARDEGIPIAIVNLGPTRADDLAAVKVEGRVGEVLPALVGTAGAGHGARYAV